MTLVTRATFELRRDGVARLAATGPPDSTGAEWAPRKLLADVVVQGAAHPEQRDAVSAVLGFAIGRGPEVLLRKRIVALGCRRRPTDPRDAVTGTPLSWERTWGGAGSDNPVGVDLATEASRLRGACFVAADSSRVPAGLGAIPPTFPTRQRFLRPSDRASLEARPWAFASDLDLRHFQFAPSDQRLPFLRGGEQILLVGLVPSAPRFATRLPSLVAHARLFDGVTGGHPVALHADTLSIDAEHGTATVTHRGTVLVASAARAVDRLAEVGTWRVEASLVPCRDLEETVGSPRSWREPSSAREPPPLAVESPTVDPVGLDDESGFASASFARSFAPRDTRRVVVVKATFDLLPEGGDPPCSATPSRPGGDELAPDGGPDAELLTASDFAAHKSMTDVLLRGTAHAEKGATACVVSLTLGPLSHRVVVAGPRTWDATGVPTAPRSLDPLPLRWAHAHGGTGDAANPAGRSLDDDLPPRIEDPARLVRSRRDRPAPAGFGPISPAWAAPARLLGTYDATWRRERWPHPPSNFDPTFFQSAPQARRIPEPRGGEPFRITSVRPDGAGYEGTLPRLRPRAFAVRPSGASTEVRLVLDTVVFDTDAGLLHLTFRGSFAVEGRERVRVAVFREDSRMPLSSDEVAARLAGRFEPVLLPDRSDEDATSRVDAHDEDEDAHASFHLGAALTRDGAAPLTALALGAAASGAGPQPPPAAPTRAEVEALVADGRDLRGRDLSDADLRGIDLSGRDLTGVVLARARLQGARFDGARLHGAVLSFADAPGSSWIGAELTRIEATGAILRGARLDRARLERASLVDADLEAACLDAATATGATFARANLRGCSARAATFEKADFSRATLEGATLEGAVLRGAKLIALRGAKASFVEANLMDSRFEKAALAQARFDRCDARAAVWECCDLERASFDRARLEGAVFAASRLDKASLVAAQAMQASFAESRLEGARLDGANAMAASFEGADLRNASLRGANLFDANLFGARLAGADLAHALGAPRTGGS